MNFLPDLVLILFFVLFILMGVYRGFIRSAAHFLGTVIAAALAGAMGGFIAQWVFDGLFRDALIEKITESIGTMGVDNVVASIQGFLSSLPEFLVRALEEAGVSASAIAGTVSAQTSEIAVAIADALSPVFVSFLKVLAVIVLFALFMILVRIAADMLGKFLRLPILRQVDGLLGGVFGLLLALVFVWVIVSAVQVFMPMLSYDTQADIDILLNRSFILGTVVELNPLTKMFS